MKYLINIFVIIFSYFPIIINAQVHFPYFPVHIGDKWEWYSNIDSSTYSDSITNVVEKDDGSTDVYMHNSLKPRYNVKSNGNVYQYFGNSLNIWYDLTVSPGDTFYTKIYSEEYYVTVDSTEWKIYGENSKIRIFRWIDVKYQSYSSTQAVSDKFGLCSTESWLGPLNDYVIGCKINGKTYGTLVSIKDNNLGMTNTFQLYQNYPNPFNPNTTIQYSINKSGFVNISVYNLLGEKISTLVNEYKTNGSYIVSFNGKNLSSGIYFYKISSNGRNQILKMELLK